ncbi:MAG: cell division protein FtsA [Alistipes sp.]|nr:cell division protein FtsA [Alistipes sp.]
MNGKQIVAIDVGSSNVVIAVGMVEDNGLVTIRGIVSEPVEGVNAGHVENSEMVSRAVVAAKERIEMQLGVKISEAYAGLSGDFIRCVQVTDLVYVQDELHNGSNQITQRDVDELDRRMKSVKLPDNRETIIAMQPLRYKIDEHEVEVPVGAYGRVLSATYNFILCDKAMSDRLRRCLQQNNISVKEIVPNAMVLHNTIATTDDMQDGAVIVDFGGGVTDVAVLYGGKVRYMASIPIGASSINNDIRSLSIPSNYIEDLKIQYGSAVAALAIDDMIVFQASKRSPVKNILRKNLAIVIEARLKEIAEWVRREIKEAGCGSKFAPALLLTGGGSQMRDIEKLFARELEIEDARTVHPEYGFTEESLLEHISSPADATVASLLVYGAKRGSCTIGVRANVETPREPEVVAPRRPMGISQHDRVAHENTNAPEPQPYTQQPVQPSYTPPQPMASAEEVFRDIVGDDDIPQKEKRSFGEKIRKIFQRAGESFIGEVDESDY